METKPFPKNKDLREIKLKKREKRAWDLKKIS